MIQGGNVRHKQQSNGNSDGGLVSPKKVHEDKGRNERVPMGRFRKERQHHDYFHTLCHLRVQDCNSRK